MNNDLHSWWTSIPPVTRFLFGMSMALTVGAGFGLLDAMSLLLFWPFVISQVQVSVSNHPSSTMIMVMMIILIIIIIIIIVVVLSRCLTSRNNRFVLS
jgi:hypothetical protein